MPLGYKDIIDLEYFFHRDAEADEGDLHRRDRTLFLDHQQEQGDKVQPSRPELVRLWLTARANSDFPDPEQRSPGTLFGDAHLLAKYLAVGKGLLVGLVAGLTFFTYTGTTPVNVFHFLLFFVIGPLALLGLLLGACLLRLFAPGLRLPSFYSLLLRGTMSRLTMFLNRHWLAKIDADKRAGYAYALNIFRTRGAVYGSLFYWPLFGLVQLFAVGFYIGLPAATLLKISTSDLAFGWQSTLQLSGEVIHRAVQLAALPWSWFLAGATGYPSLAEIEGSRIILKEGIYHLATEDLVAWWPFLVFCLVFYGLLPRLALAVFGRMVERRALRRVNLDTAAVVTLARRMQTPLVSTQAAPERDQTKPSAAPDQPREEPAAAPHLLPQVVLIPDDIVGLCPTAKLSPLLGDRGFAIKSVHTFMAGYDEDEEIKDLLAEQLRTPEDGLFILMEGWMPPLVAFVTYIGELRRILPDKTMIHLGLVGRPVRAGFTPLAARDLAIWRKKMAAVRDPYLHVFTLIS